jgi:hypothetical protein
MKMGSEIFQCSLIVNPIFQCSDGACMIFPFRAEVITCCGFTAMHVNPPQVIMLQTTKYSNY